MVSFSPLEKTLIEIMHEYISRNGGINLGDIVNFCYNRLKGAYSKEVVERNLQSIIQKRYLCHHKRIFHEDFFQNPIRKRIIQYIRKNPGAYNRKIRDALKIHSNEFEWHCAMLQRFGFIKKVKFFGRQYGYFENRSYMGHEFDLFLLQNEKVEKILNFLKRHAYSTISQLNSALGIHYSTIKKYIEILKKREFITEIPDHRNGSRSLLKLNREIYDRIRKIRNGQVFIEFAEPPINE